MSTRPSASPRPETRSSRLSSVVSKGVELAPHAAQAAAVLAPAAAGAGVHVYGSQVQEGLAQATEALKAELQAELAQHRQELKTEHELMLGQLRAESDRVRDHIRTADEQLQEIARVMADRIETVAYEARDEFNRMAAQFRGEGDERLDVIEDHVRMALERIRVSVDEATHEAVLRVRNAAETNSAGLGGPSNLERNASDSSFYLSPDQADEDNIDLG